MSTKRRAYLTEMKTQLTLAVPALLAQIAMISMGFVDMVMTGLFCYYIYPWIKLKIFIVCDKHNSFIALLSVLH